MGQEKQHGAVMSADVYRAKAVEFFTMARAETNPRLQVEYASIAESYFRLALLADKNQENDVVYETPRRGQIQKP
jgi:hypothetical protein